MDWAMVMVMVMVIFVVGHVFVARVGLGCGAIFGYIYVSHSSAWELKLFRVEAMRRFRWCSIPPSMWPTFREAGLYHRCSGHRDGSCQHGRAESLAVRREMLISNSHYP